MFYFGSTRHTLGRAGFVRCCTDDHVPPRPGIRFFMHVHCRREFIFSICLVNFLSALRVLYLCSVADRRTRALGKEHVTRWSYGEIYLRRVRFDRTFNEWCTVLFVPYIKKQKNKKKQFFSIRGIFGVFVCPFPNGKLIFILRYKVYTDVDVFARVKKTLRTRDSRFVFVW